MVYHILHAYFTQPAPAYTGWRVARATGAQRRPAWRRHCPHRGAGGSRGGPRTL